MGKFDGILICTDLDGTLYKNDKTISAENRSAIEYFKREGGYFTFVTGRMPNYSMDAYRAVNPNVPFGCINGGGVYDGAAGKYVWTCTPLVNVTDLLQCIDNAFPEVGIQICTFDKTFFVKENETMVDFRRITGLPFLTCDYRSVTEPIAKIIFGTDREEDIQGVEKMLRAHPKAGMFDFIRSEKKLFEILPKGVQKGLAIERLVEYLGTDMSKTVGIGDYNNDVGMFHAAAIGIAVANASPAAREAADFITVSNEEHAIARVISDVEHEIYRF